MPRARHKSEQERNSKGITQCLSGRIILELPDVPTAWSPLIVSVSDVSVEQAWMKEDPFSLL